jgi:hypothetical protein
LRQGPAPRGSSPLKFCRGPDLSAGGLLVADLDVWTFK